MNLEKLNPWNWFKYEDSVPSQPHQIPVSRKDAGVLATSSQLNSLLQSHQQMDQLFNDALTAFGMSSFGASLPSQRLIGDEFSSAFRSQIDVLGDVLMIKGQEEEVNESKDKQFYRAVRRKVFFLRTLLFLGDASADDIVVRFNDEVLTFGVPRHPS